MIMTNKLNLPEGSVRAASLFDREEGASLLTETKGGSHFAGYRQGESIKWRSYCICRKYCSYYKESVAADVTGLIEGPAAA